MKKCPVCEKTFEDSMRFCQTDGTPLVEEIPEDPYKTTVAGRDEIAAALPPLPDDPFKTMVAGAQSKEESEDLLQIPEEDNFDPMKTMVNPQSNTGQEEAIIKPKEEIKIEPIKDTASPPSPFDNAATPSQPRTEDKSDAFPATPPSMPKFNEPSISPPSFSDVTPPSSPQSGSSASSFNDSEESTTNDQTVMYPSSPLPPLPKETSEPPPPTMLGDSPFGTPNNAPMPSPFGDPPKPSYEMPSSPPLPTYQEPEPSPFSNQSNPFNQPSFNQGENINQNMQQQDWNPPPAPDSNWQNQNVGQNTPFQPPPAGGGLNQTLPIISLVLGIVSICCYISPLTGIAALITGFLGMKNANNDPSQYGGKGLAIAGMITGGVFLLLGVLYYILIFLGVAMGSFNRF